MKRTDLRSGIAALSHRVSLCTMHDVVTTDGVMVLTREKVLSMWASIEAKLGSMFARDGIVIQESTSRQTHIICMRYRRDFDITSAAWVYEERLQSAPRWFKVLAVSDDGQDMWKLKCRLVQSSDVITEPVEPGETCAPVAIPGSAVPLPPGVKL